MPVPVCEHLIFTVVTVVVRATTLTDEYIKVYNKPLKELLKKFRDNNFLVYGIYAITVLTIRKK